MALPIVEPSTARILDELRDDPRLTPFEGRAGRAVFGPLGHFLRRVLPRLPRSLIDPVGQRHAFEAAAERYLAGVAETEARASTIAGGRGPAGCPAGRASRTDRQCAVGAAATFRADHGAPGSR